MRLLLLTLVALSPAAQASETPGAAQARIEAADAAYGQAFEYFAELCSATEYRPLKQKAGNGYGHAVLLVKGACVDESAELPRLKFCPQGEVGVSVDSNYDNVKWTAAPSRSLMLYGDVSADHPFTAEDNEASVQKALSTGMFKGVRLVDDPAGPHQRPGESYEHMVAQWSIGTNFGLALSRNVTCVHIPLVAGEDHPKEEVVKALIAEMNRRNELAQAKHSNWDYASNNCTDTAVNELAAIGFNKAVPTDWDMPSALRHPLKFRKALNEIAVPYDEMLNALLWGNDAGPHSGYAGNFLSPAAAANLENLGWMGAQPGVIVEQIPVHTEQNSVFNTDTRVDFGNGALSILMSELLSKLNLENLALDLPNAKARLYARTLKKPRYVDLTANLEWWKDTYSALPASAYTTAKLADVKRLLNK